MRNVCLILFIFAALGCSGRTANVGSNQSGRNTNTVSNSAEPTTDVANFERVTLESPDKTIIVGSFFDSPKPNSPAVLLLHQWQSDRHPYDDFAERLQAKGFNVLSVDGRGFGESTKTTDGKTVAPERTDEAVKAMLGDVGAAVDFLSKQKNVDPNRLGIVGASYGSSLAIIYAADNPKIKAVALLSPGLNYFGNMLTEPAVTAYGNGRPLLVVAAKDDLDSVDTVHKFFAHASTETKWEMAIRDTGGHGTALLRTGHGLEELIQQFLRTYL